MNDRCNLHLISWSARVEAQDGALGRVDWGP